MDVSIRSEYGRHRVKGHRNVVELHSRACLSFPSIQNFPLFASKTQRLSVNTHMKETLIHTLEDVARDVVGVETRTTGIDNLQTIMTEAKEKVHI